MKHQTCNAIGCRALILPTFVFCARHSAILQSDILTLVGRAYRPNAHRQSSVFDVHLARARDEILYAQMAGHRAPRDGEFEF